MTPGLANHVIADGAGWLASNSERTEQNMALRMTMRCLLSETFSQRGESLCYMGNIASCCRHVPDIVR